MVQILNATVVQMFNIILQKFLHSNIFSNILQILMVILNSYSVALNDFEVVFSHVTRGLNVTKCGCHSKIFTLAFAFFQ